MALPKAPGPKQVSFLTGSTDRVPFRVTEPKPVASVLKFAELIAERWPGPEQALFAVGRSLPVVMVVRGGSPLMAQGLVALP